MAFTFLLSLRDLPPFEGFCPWDSSRGKSLSLLPPGREGGGSVLAVVRLEGGVGTFFDIAEEGERLLRQGINIVLQGFLACRG